MSNEQAKPSDMSDPELCQRFGVESVIVGDIYDVDERGDPIPEEDRKKWMVTTPADRFPTALIKAIPLAASETESQELAVKYLMLPVRDTILSRPASNLASAKERSMAIPTPVYLAFIMDATYWPNDDVQTVYAVDLVLEVDGKRYEQDELEPATFPGTSEVVIVEGAVFDDWKPLHSMRQHFENWITGHKPTPAKVEEGA